MATEVLADTMQLSICHGDIQFYFVTKSGTVEDASKDLSYSYELIADFSSSTEHLEWISENNCLLLPPESLSKQNIFILDNFEGRIFDHLSSTKAIVLGPRCVLSCQLTNDVVPNIASPIFTLAMKNVVACVSGINAERRSEIHKLIGFMGGLWTKDLSESNTHLITNTIKSIKYEKAALRNMNIMNEQWVFDVWTISKTEDTSYTTEEFFRKYKLPILHNLVITSTGITESEKCEIKKLIHENGGSYNGSFKSNFTDILITQPNQKNSDKFKAAVKCRKECLMVDWIRDSVTKGYALPFTNYRIYAGQPSSAKVFNSTQLSNQSANFTANATQLSAIVNDSIAESTLAKNTPQISASKSIPSTYKTTLENIDMSLVKKAEGCLENVTIWLCGFELKETEKLKKIINIVGAIRFDEHDSTMVQYVIVGKPNSSEQCILKSLKSSNIVSVDWLVASIKTRTIADPKEFIYYLALQTSNENQTVPSPASRKNIESMRPVRKAGVKPRRLELDDEDANENREEKTLLAQYSYGGTTSQMKSRHDADTTVTDTHVEMESDSLDRNLFQGRTIAIFGFSEESSIDLMDQIEEGGGINVNDGDLSKTVDYLVITADTNSLSEVKSVKAKEIVTEIWIQECLTVNKMVDIKYYHRPIILKEDLKPLNGLHIVFSTYTSSERDYLIKLAEALGGEVNERYIRRQNPILVCPTPDGQKYNGAIKWNLPVVSCEWLIKCHKLEENVPLNKYLVGEAKWENENIQKSAIIQNKHIRSDKSSTSDQSDKTPTTDTSDKTDHVDVNNHQEKDASNVSNDNDVFVTPMQHRRVSTIKNGANRQVSPLTQSQGTPVDAIAKYCEDIPTPISRGIVYDLLKSCEDKESPLSRRRRLANVSDSPYDMSALDPPDYFEMIDRKFIEIPKTRQSTPFAEYRKRMYIKVLGDQYDGSPLRHPYEDDVQENKTKDESNTDEPSSSVSTQVQNFGNFIKRYREERKSIAEQNTTVEKKNNEEEQQLIASNVFSQVDVNSENDEQPAVGWRDPDEFFQSERFFSGSRKRFKGTMCFSMSLGVETSVEVETLKERILSLNGTLCEDMTSFDPSCTHLICTKPSQSEKTLSIIAAGRWLLYVNYIEDSFNAGHFLDEENYEWGNPKAESKLPFEIDSKTKGLVAASHKWRTELQKRSKQENKPVGIFSNFRVILHTQRKASFKRLLEAGCGVVVDIKEPYSEQNDIHNVTHCFVDKKMKISESDRLALDVAGVQCVNILYLMEYIQSNSLPSVEGFLI